VDLKFRDHLKTFERISYVKTDEKTDTDRTNFIDCSLGVNPYGCSGLLKTAWEDFDFDLIYRYPDFPYTALKQKIKEYWQDAADLKEENIKLGSGSVDILEKLNKIFVERGSKVLGYCPQFTDYMTDVKSCGGIYEYTALKPENNYRFDAEEFLAAVSGEHVLVYIDNPNNPTGQVIPLPEIEYIAGETAKRNVCVIVDEAYGDFIGREESAISIIEKYENLAVVRSFSKGFGLAGARVGYMASGKLISDYYSKVESPFAVSSFGHYTARLALDDGSFLEECREKVKEAKEGLISGLTRLKIPETDPRVPIMTLQHPSEDINLHDVFLRHRVLTEAGEDFMELGKNCVRLRVPARTEEIQGIISKIEGGL